MSAYKISFKIEGSDPVTVVSETGETLLDIAKRTGVVIDAPCGGNGTCGKCRIRLTSGTVESGESSTITKEDAADGWRLACCSKPTSDLEVFLPASAQAFQSRIRITDFSGSREKAAFDALKSELKAMEFTGDFGIEKADVQVDEPSIEDALADRERVKRAIAAAIGVEEDDIKFSLQAMRRLSLALRGSGYEPSGGGGGQFNITVIFRRKESGKITIIDALNANEKDKTIYGLAIDIGTTTVSMMLVNMETQEPVHSASGGNAQIRYGADVINRIIQSAKPLGLEKLRTAIIAECLTPLIKRLCINAGISAQQIYRATIAGNTTMTHFVLGVNAEYLRLEPYVPAFFHTNAIKASAMSLPINDAAEVLCAPAVGSYVGGDITAGVFSSMIYKKDTLQLFIDLGTNGEIVFGSQEFMFSCACSAGPAFEGGEISCGMRATNGAIEACTIDAATMEPTLKIIGEANQKAAGLCGSGLIDIIGELFKCGIINAKGKFDKEGKRIKKDEYGGCGYIVAFAAESESGKDIILNEVDIDNFIRAKGSIFSAIRTMLASVDMTQDVIEDVWIAGGIGSGIDVAHAIGIGMLPNLPLEKFHYIGNSSLTGAYSMLVSNKAAAQVEAIADGITYLELSTVPSYMDEFVAACFLPHTDASLFS
ncbi:MAG: corrinoid activation/regeneration protein AcsV [Termitinemataceae bacterium]|nr:MAG: corrinoid activation/regeneration protein AcsV [Termitinemataceae bacterium]